MNSSAQEQAKGRGRPASGFLGKIVNKASIINQRYQDWKAERLFPENLDVETTLEGDTPFGPVSFDEYKDYCRVLGERLVVRIGEVNINLGAVEVVNPEAESDLGKVRVVTQVAPYFRKFIPYASNVSQPLSDYEFAEMHKRFKTNKSYADLAEDDEKLNLVDRIIYLKYVSDSNLIQAAQRQTQESVSNGGLVTSLQRKTQVKGSITAQPQIKRLEGMCQKRLSLKDQKKLYNLPKQRSSFRLVSLLPVYVMQVLMRLKLLPKLMQRFGRNFTRQILELSCARMVKPNFRLGKQQHVVYAQKYLSLSLITMRTDYYMNTYNIAERDYLITDEAKNENIVAGYQGLIDAYVLCNREAFKELNIDCPVVLGDGTSLRYRSATNPLSQAGMEGSSKTIQHLQHMFIYYESNSRLILDLDVRAGNTNDLLAAPAAVRKNIREHCDIEYNFDELTLVEDRGCTSRESMFLKLLLGCKFVSFTKPNTKELRSARAQMIKEYTDTYGVNLHLDPFKLMYARQSRPEKSDERFEVKMAKQFTAYELGFCTKDGKARFNVDLVDERHDFKSKRINPNTRLTLVITCPPVYRIPEIAAEIAQNAVDRLNKLNSGDLKYNKLTAEEKEYIVPITLNEFVDKPREMMLEYGLSNLHDKATKARDKFTLNDWREGLMIDSLSYKEDFATYKNSKLPTPEPEDYVDETFCYTIDRAKFNSQAHDRLYNLIVTNHEGTPDEVAVRATADYSNRMYVEALNGRRKHYGGRARFCKADTSYAVSEISTMLIATTIGYIQQQLMEWEIAHNPGKKDIRVLSSEQIIALLSQHHVLVNYITKEVKADRDQVLPREVTRLLQKLGLSQLTIKDVEETIKMMWNLHLSPQPTAIEQICLNREDRDNDVDHEYVAADEDDVDSEIIDRQILSRFDYHVPDITQDAALNHVVQSYEKPAKFDFILEMNKLALAMSGKNDWTEARDQF